MVNLIEVKIFQNYEELKLILPKIKEILDSNREITISWKKTQEEIYEETFHQNKPIKNQNQYQILENLTQRVLSQNTLYNKIMMTMIEYDVEQKDYLKFNLNFNRLSNSQLTENLKTQLIELLKKIKKQLKSIVNIEERFILIKILQQENLLLKEELKQQYSLIKPYVNEENKQICIWFLEQILIYEKQNQLLLSEIYEYYIQEQNQEQAQKYLQLIFSQPISDLNDEEEIQSKYQTIKTKNNKIFSEILEIEELLNNNYQNNQAIEQLQNLIELKTELGYPIQEMLINYQKLSQNLIQKRNIEQAISTINSCMDKIKLELLINYNSKLILYDSFCYELLGDCYRFNNQIQLSIDAYQQALMLKKEIKYKTDSKRLIFIKSHMAAMYFKLQQYQISLDIYINVLKLQEETDQNENNQSQFIGQTQYNIASIYLCLGKRQLAEEFCEQAITNMALKLGDQNSMIKQAKKLREKIVTLKSSRQTQIRTSRQVDLNQNQEII